MIIGRADNGTAVGVPNAKHLLKTIPDTVHNKLNFIPSVNIIMLDGKECIEIIVEKQEFHPSYDQKFYVRSGSTTQQITGAKLKRLLISDLNIVWTDEIDEKTELSDISAESVRNFVVRGKKHGRIHADADENDTGGTLRKFNLMNDDGITMAGALLFRDDPKAVNSDAVIRIGLFSKERMFLMDDIIEGPMIEQPDKAMEMLRLRYIQPRFDVEGAYRVDRYKFPMKAIREAIQNAVVHRAYYEDGAITVRVYEDSVEIYNPGFLPAGWTVKDLMREHESVSPNKSMANVFYSANMIEKWGHGIRMMCKECLKNGNPEPEFRIETNGIRVIFRSRPRPYGRGAVQMPEGLTSSETDIYKAIVGGDFTTAEDMASALGSSVKTVRRATDKLKEKNLIRRAGSNRKGVWEPNI
jgi:ATP-dependent DNA helicase RecG